MSEFLISVTPQNIYSMCTRIESVIPFLPHLVLEMVSLVAIAANKNRGNLALNRELDKFSIF